MNKLVTLIFLAVIVGILLQRGTINNHNYLIILLIINLWMALYASEVINRKDKKGNIVPN